MGCVNQTTSFPIPGKLTCTVHLSKELLNELYAEIQKIDPLRRKSQAEACGLLYGATTPASVRLERVERVELSDIGKFSLAKGERLHKALGDRISETRSSPGQSSALLGWYVFRGSDTRLLDRDVEFHNTFFRTPGEVAVILRVDTQGYLSLEILSAKPGGLLSKKNHRVGSWSSASVSALPEHIDVALSDIGNDDLYLDVYRTAKSLDEAESGGNWERIRKRTARLFPNLGTTPTGAGQESLLGAGLTSPIPLEIPVAPTPQRSVFQSGPTVTRTTTSTEDFPDSRSVHPTSVHQPFRTRDPQPATPSSVRLEERSNSVPQGRPELPAYFPLPVASASNPSRKGIGFLSATAWLLGTILISVLTYIASHLYIKPILLKVAAQASTGAVITPRESQTPQPAFGLVVNQSGSALELRWDPRSPALQLATSCKLVINDGGLTRAIDMDKAQLTSGRIVYTPVSGDVRFSLEATDSASRTITDSIRVLGNPSEGFSNGTRRHDSRNVPPHKNMSDWTTVHHPRLAETQSSSPKTSENRSPGLPENSSALLITPPVSSFPGFNGIPAFPASPAFRAEQVNASSQALHQKSSPGISSQDLPLRAHPQLRLQVTSSIADQSAALFAQPIPTQREVRKDSPAIALYKPYPTLHHGALLGDALVSVVVQVSEAGRVTSVGLDPSNKKVPAEISKQALAAAREWRFLPAKVNGKAVNSTTRIDFLFRPSKESNWISTTK